MPNSLIESTPFEAFFNYASMGIVVLNDRMIIQSANPFALNLFGYSIEEIVGKPIAVLIPQHYHHKDTGNRDKYIHQPKNRPMVVGMDLFAIKKDGTVFPVELSMGNYKNNDELNEIVFISDISVRKNAEREVEKLHNKLEEIVGQRTIELTNAMQQLEFSKEELSRSLVKEKELSELKSKFVSIASHEFRTPLSTILSSTYLIEKYPESEDQPKRAKHLERIVSSVDMLTEILNDFLSVDKIEEGKVQIRTTDFNIREVLNSIIKEIKIILKKRQVIHYHHKGQTEVTLDPSLLKHIVMNLVSNASKFTPETGLIEITTVCTNRKIILSVKDTGMGISREDQKHLMERFFRGGNACDIQGTGLGLHIVSKYAELMNGRVECRSELEQGTEFIITFNSK